MSIIKKNLILISIFTLLTLVPTKAEDLKKIGKFKDWQTMVFVEPSLILNEASWFRFNGLVLQSLHCYANQPLTLI